MEDPFFVVKEEVEKALATVNQLYVRWKELQDNTLSKEELTWTATEINNNIRSIEWDLEDLTETISVVESNPSKFNLSATDIEQRQHFISITKNSINTMKDTISLQSKGKSEKESRNALLTKNNYNNKYARLDNEIEQSNQRFIDDQFQQQQLLLTNQKTQLEHVGQSVGVLKSMGKHIGSELDEQAIIIDELNHEVDQTDSRLQTVLVRVEKMLKLADDKKQTYVLIALILMCLVVVILFVAI
ncbi:syntaxin-6 isoform X2 [Hydra vulgaris]|uniref:Syntaxin-6 isoform X2 n=1 Tax=Hydra vulgaris TaxID=6087 RepID=A0ABM4BFW4_HYDVU